MTTSLASAQANGSLFSSDIVMSGDTGLNRELIDDMSKSKLSPVLKALIGAPFARPNTLPATPKIRSIYKQLKDEALSKEVTPSSWIALSVRNILILTLPYQESTFPGTTYLANKGKIDSSNNDNELSRISRHTV